ncbi:hypothetical protein UPYG_G00035030 [Umbra pygmaea]|uniref:HAUS augmin-like complex subunit 8 n=1 Tax=Umbra pygmaea TaxID=75934 RepID=A0ABD0XNN4_UMBPY
MASRRQSSVPKSQRPILGDSKGSNNSGTGNTSRGNSSGAGNKIKSSITVVKSRYLQPVEKAPVAKVHPLLNDSTFVLPRPASPKPGGIKTRIGSPARRSMAPQTLKNLTPMMSTVIEPPQLGMRVLQSTFLDGNSLDGHRLPPDIDVSAIDFSVIKDKTVLPDTVLEPERNDQQKKSHLEMQTFLLAYLTAKMEHNNQKLKEEAEGRILAVMEEEEQLWKEVHEKKRMYHLLEKNKQLDGLLDLQITALTPVAAVAKQFTQEYKDLSSAVDTTRHELPVKSFYIEGDRMEFLDKTTTNLKAIEEGLLQCTHGALQDNDQSAECLRGMKAAAQDISEQLSRGVSELMDLSSLVSRLTVQTQQALEEEQLGLIRAQELYCPKP